MVFSTGPLDWKSRVLNSRPLLHKASDKGLNLAGISKAARRSNAKTFAMFFKKTISEHFWTGYTQGIIYFIIGLYIKFLC